MLHAMENTGNPAILGILDLIRRARKKNCRHLALQLIKFFVAESLRRHPGQCKRIAAQGQPGPS